MTNNLDKKKNLIRLACEILPVAFFLIAFKFYDIIAATIVITIATLLGTLIIYLIDKKISTTQSITCVLLVVFGSLTIITKDSSFIKMKPTILYALFAIVLFYGVCIKKTGYLSVLFGKSIKLHNKEWILISARLGFLLILTAVTNEIIWRNFPENTWVQFKLFGLPAILMLFFGMHYKYFIPPTTHK